MHIQTNTHTDFPDNSNFKKPGKHWPSADAVNTRCCFTKTYNYSKVFHLQPCNIHSLKESLFNKELIGLHFESVEQYYNIIVIP